MENIANKPGTEGYNQELISKLNIFTQIREIAENTHPKWVQTYGNSRGHGSPATAYLLDISQLASIEFHVNNPKGHEKYEKFSEFPGLDGIAPDVLTPHPWMCLKVNENFAKKQVFPLLQILLTPESSQGVPIYDEINDSYERVSGTGIPYLQLISKEQNSIAYSLAVFLDPTASSRLENLEKALVESTTANFFDEIEKIISVSPLPEWESKNFKGLIANAKYANDSKQLNVYHSNF